MATTEALDDEDIRLQRASAGLVADLQSSLGRILWKSSSTGNRQLHRGARPRDLDRVISLVEPFQEDPQLLDTQLKHIVPVLVSAYLEHLKQASTLQVTAKIVTISHVICRILYTLCKVRGEKVIVSFLNNEPRYLEPILDKFEEGLKAEILSWEEKYISLLWLSHLMLAPFDLASISSHQPAGTASKQTDIKLPETLPGITNRILPICIDHLSCATRERDAAGKLLVRMSLRPDMRKAGLLDALVGWALSFVTTTEEKISNIHQALGILVYLSGLVSSANTEELGTFIADIYKSCDRIINQGNLIFVKSSAVARKLVIKTLRNIVVNCLQAGPPTETFDTSSLLEDVIDFLLQSMGDADSPVRYAASKALSIIIMKLPAELASEVIEAILGCLNEDVFWERSTRNLNAVNALRWHGLTLTLSHLLYRRAPPTTQLPEIINALVLALSFEQRSATGGSIGANVRDAACFGIWALSRRYTTQELSVIDCKEIRATEGYDQAFSIPQVLALELLTTACMDPAGNIRRGSSAALQELIGRHPNTVHEGITLVQIVDFHAVGLRERAITEVGLKAAQLGQLYWKAMFEGMLGWRGIGSLDANSRNFSATAIGRLSRSQPYNTVKDMFDRIRKVLEGTSERSVEDRHGLVLTLAALIDACDCRSGLRDPSKGRSDPLNLLPEYLLELGSQWDLLDSSLNLSERAFTSTALRPELTATAICSFLSALAQFTFHIATLNPTKVESPNLPSGTSSQVTRLLNLCLGRTESTVLGAVSAAVRHSVLLLGDEQRDGLVQLWLSQLSQMTVRTGLRGSGQTIALGSIFFIQEDAMRLRITDVITSRCTTDFEVDARVVALQSLRIIIAAVAEQRPGCNSGDEVARKASVAIQAALNDYTINERGDVGSLVRLEALTTIEHTWKSHILEGLDINEHLYAAVVRLSLEKLDKVRLRAAECLQRTGRGCFDSPDILDASGVSSHEYFAKTLQLLRSDARPTTRLALLEGYTNSAGLGSESVVQATRQALAEKLVTISPETGGEYTLLHATNELLEVFKTHLSNDRVVLPLLEVFGFLLDMQVLNTLIGTDFKWRNLLSLVQKAHYKSNNMHKLHLAMDVYRGLADVPVIRADVLTKLTSMLLHPFPKIRIAAAETLFVVTWNEELKLRDWSMLPKNLRPAVEAVKSNEAHR
ncbi:hypothetical protein K490DRAFT_52336 [Saccharata proteae CBS 121410]|uniref:Tubulin-specific chaperone D C-terminal domain-containing protein n=1 Tax=Saccharata proteae CBS 121410 TaxID=1314787 RepID=A0A9P4HMU6_9PEZI|nr:hypothetical protein K490DRAFT_52336 [Saccharata proteae CBS 121410]